MIYKKILVNMNSKDLYQPGLNKAILLAKYYQSAITVFHNTAHLTEEATQSLEENAQENLNKEETEQLRQIINQATEEAEASHLKIDIYFDEKKKNTKNLISFAEANNFDLIITSNTETTEKLGSLIFTNENRLLCRESKTPILMARKKMTVNYKPNLICAIDLLGHPDDEHCYETNKNLIETSLHLAKAINLSVHLLNAYPSKPYNLSKETKETKNYEAEIIEQRSKMLYELAEKFDIPTTNCHIIKGLAEDAISLLANQISSEMVVTGNHCRSGLIAAFIGNTSEEVIFNLDCDLLSIKNKEAS